jgi:Amt family ammonium transporter
MARSPSSLTVPPQLWGGGWLKSLGAQDFAGGIVIHTSAGIGSLIVAKLVGRRLGFSQHHGDPAPSSILLASVGATFLWVGWFGFNGGMLPYLSQRSSASVILLDIFLPCHLGDSI